MGFDAVIFIEIFKNTTLKTKQNTLFIFPSGATVKDYLSWKFSYHLIPEEAL